MILCNVEKLRANPLIEVCTRYIKGIVVEGIVIFNAEKNNYYIPIYFMQYLQIFRQNEVIYII